MKQKEKNLNLVLNYIDKKDFFKLQSRNACLQIIENFFRYSILELNKIRGLKFDQLVVSNNGFADCYGQANQFEVVNKKIRQIYNQSKSIEDYYEMYALSSFEEYIGFARKMNKKYSGRKTAFSAGEVFEDYDNFSEINARFISNLWFIFLSDSVIDEMLKDLILKYLKKISKENELQEYLTLISTSLKRSAIPREHKDLLKIASMEEGNKHKEQNIKKHWKKWRWFPCYNPCDDAHDLGHYKNELKQYSVTTAKEELKKTKNDQAEHKKAYNKFLKNIKYKKLIKLVKMTNEICFYREHRNDLRREGLFLIRPFYKKIGKNLGLSDKEICYLTKEEIKKSLKTGELQVPKNIIRNRINKYVLFVKGKDMILIDDKKTLEKINKAIKYEDWQNNILKGSSTSGGLVQAKAFVITDIDKLKDFKQGDILVVSMTAPDYVPIMKKAAAIVTDEGGITCHAAIVSRELKIPCVIGTKIATKVLKDGDLVEVDAERGIVRKL